MENIFSAAALVLEQAFASRGFSIWLVGGAVRDTLLGETPKDFDFATDATPDEQIAVYEAARIRYVPTGLQHGTLTAIIDDEPFEVTTLRTESDHDGRYATMTFTRSLVDDLARRDLTINAMAMTMAGEVIDPFNGRRDLKNRIVRFVGSADDRIREDYLRILRWVRFHQRFANGHPFDPETLAAVERHATGLRQISVERVWAELSKAITYDHAADMLDMLCDSGIAWNIGMPRGYFSAVYMLADRSRDPVTRLAAFYRSASTIDALALKWKWSAAERKQAKEVSSLLNKVLEPSVQRYLVAVDGKRAYDVAEAARIMSYATDIEAWPVPSFPVTGDDLLARGVKRGPEIGNELKKMKNTWAASGYVATARELLAGL